MWAVNKACPKSCPLKSTKLSFVPSGETSGLVTPLPVPVVIRWRSAPDRFMLQMASTLVVSSKRSKKIRVPSGLNVGVASQPFRLQSEEHTSELQSLRHLVCRLLLEKK